MKKPAEFLIINMQNYSKIIQLTNNYIKTITFLLHFSVIHTLSTEYPHSRRTNTSSLIVITRLFIVIRGQQIVDGIHDGM